MLPVRALVILVLALACCSGCVTRTVSRRPRLNEIGSPRIDKETGRIVEEQTIWFWQM